MESYEDDDLALPVLEKPSSPIPRSKLKRLKRATSPSIPLSPPSLPLGDPMVINAPSIQTPSVAPHPAEIRTSSFDAMDGETFGEEIGPESDLDPLFSYPRVEESCDAPCMSSREGNEVGSRQDEGTVAVEEPRKKKKNVKRRLGLEEEGGDANKRNKKKERSRKISSRDGTVREKRKLEKARKAELEFLHAESQRLLRETRDASFKPLQIVQKSISSVLEKIRLRKLEMLKSCSILNWSDSVDDADSPVGNSVPSSEPARSKIDLKENDENPKSDYSVGNVDVADHSQGEIPSNSEDGRDSQLSTGDDILLNSHEAIPLSHPTASSFMVDEIGDLDIVASRGHDNNLSSGEESDKENIRPRACNLRDMDSSPKDDLAKAFLDDEAEEEDDSDCDLLRFHENEDENETDEHEDLDDIIATGYEDAPIDQEKRNELHQKWLEQQDAAETNNVIQRLKSGQGLGDAPFLHGGYDNYDGGEDDDKDVNYSTDDDGYAPECDDQTEDKYHLTETTRQSLKKAKHMITQMFTDANDIYIPSDDEETEKDLIRRYILKQNEEPSFVSPVENENSREVFGLIKKLNIAPGPKKSGKGSASSVFDSLVASGNSNSSSKPSFAKRVGNSLPSSTNKQGSASVRAFVFSRDDSNSKSNISTSEITTDTAQKESRAAESAMTDKFSSSQLESSIMEAKVHTKTESGLSLFNILRQTSLQFDQKSEKRSSVGSHVVTESQAAYHFSAFKVRRTKTNSRI